VQITSKRVDYAGSWVEVWKGNLERVECGKGKYDVKLHERFFVRLVAAKAGIKYYSWVKNSLLCEIFVVQEK
jgi:hypothetical protein